MPLPNSKSSCLLKCRTPLLPFVCLVFAAADTHAQQAFTSRSAFLAATSGTVRVENCDVLGSPVASLFGGRATFAGVQPTVFRGEWGAACGSLNFNGGALIPEPRFRNAKLVLEFPVPVSAVGAHVFDDYDGGLNTVTLTVLAAGATPYSISETCPREGDCGWLGVVCQGGITRAEFGISGSGNNLEIDNLTIVDSHPKSGAHVVTAVLFGSATPVPGSAVKPGIGIQAPSTGSLAFQVVGSSAPPKAPGLLLLSSSRSTPAIPVFGADIWAAPPWIAIPCISSPTGTCESVVQSPIALGGGMILCLQYVWTSPVPAVVVASAGLEVTFH